LYYREIGRGRPIVVLHGGPDFDHTYLLPDLDSLSERFRLIYYDQRGRGRSAADVRPEDVTLRSEIADLERVREYFRLDTVAVLGHSWGGLLAMEYALRHPDRVSHLVLMNSGPASSDDYELFRRERMKRTPADMEELRARSSEPAFRAGDPDTVTAYYRVHFRSALKDAKDLERLLQSLKASFTREGILRAREIERRLYGETWLSSDYSLHPTLQRLRIPTLVIHGDHDFLPRECATHIARSISGARLVLLSSCGHFAYLECPDTLRAEIVDFFRESTTKSEEPI
jgi:proline iminopeptidase